LKYGINSLVGVMLITEQNIDSKYNFRCYMVIRAHSKAVQRAWVPLLKKEAWSSHDLFSFLGVKCGYDGWNCIMR
jgi:hypothetical protein